VGGIGVGGIVVAGSVAIDTAWGVFVGGMVVGVATAAGWQALSAIAETKIRLIKYPILFFIFFSP
jgi:hypothetical protein